MKRLTSGSLLLPAATLLLASGLSGCAALSCDDYMTYDDILDSWLGAKLSEYERTTDNRAYTTMDRPQDRIEYTFNTPYTNYDGSTQSCRTFLEVDRASGRIEGWRYEGSCYMHGYCND